MRLTTLLVTPDTYDIMLTPLSFRESIDSLLMHSALGIDSWNSCSSRTLRETSGDESGYRSQSLPTAEIIPLHKEV